MVYPIHRGDKAIEFLIKLDFSFQFRAKEFLGDRIYE